MQKPLVSVRFMVYNNEPYIREAIESILMQQTNFKVEIVVGDDFSTDNTLDIIKSYRDTENIHINILDRPVGGDYWKARQKLGRLHNFKNIIDNCQGKYIALCDGDDYWTDPLKLQKQVDFLESNHDVNICFTRTQLLKNEVFSMHNIPKPFNNSSFKYIELIRHYNFIATCSVIFIKPRHFEFPNWFHKLPFGDLGIYKLVSEDKDIQCIDEAMSVYRIHDNGIYSGISALKKQQNYLSFYKIIFQALNSKEKHLVSLKIKEVTYRISKLKFPNRPWFQKCYNRYLRLKF
ncbi:glycosyltransferase [Winogradskyella helgolandensis]|uniref:glycosyltransferase n=1 Tax=Winogradskyella helgolandensis TaxID=2697010 RepID=UPI0015BAE44B|nr:glycosyltransferase [Winogradskyella helgolandensis]